MQHIFLVMCITTIPPLIKVPEATPVATPVHAPYSAPMSTHDAPPVVTLATASTVINQVLQPSAYK